MTDHLVNPPTPRPLDPWAPVSVELLGTQSRLVHGERGSPTACDQVIIEFILG